MFACRWIRYVLIGVNRATGGWQNLIVDTLVGHSVDENDMARERREVILLIWGDEKLLRPTDVSACDLPWVSARMAAPPAHRQAYQRRA